MKEPKKLTVAQLHRAWELGATHYHVFGRHAELLKSSESGGWLGRLVNRDGKDGKSDEAWEPVTTDDVDDPQPVPTLEDHHVEMMGEIQMLLIEKYNMRPSDSAQVISNLENHFAALRWLKTEPGAATKLIEGT